MVGVKTTNHSHKAIWTREGECGGGKWDSRTGNKIIWKNGHSYHEIRLAGCGLRFGREPVTLWTVSARTSKHFEENAWIGLNFFETFVCELWNSRNILKHNFSGDWVAKNPLIRDSRGRGSIFHPIKTYSMAFSGWRTREGWNLKSDVCTCW